MTKELELLAERLENLSSRLSGQVTDSGADFAWLIIYNYAIEIEQINHTLATLAKTQEGMVNIPVPRWQDKHEEYGGIFSDIKCAQDEIDQLRMRLAGISQQKAPEGDKS